MNNKIFDKETFLAFNDMDAMNKASAIRGNFSAKKSFYTQIGNSSSALHFWFEYKEKLAAFEVQHTLLDREWSSVSNSKSKHVISEHFEKTEAIFSEFQSYIEQKMPNETRSGDIEKLKQEVLFDIETKFNDVSAHVKEKVDLGIRDLIDLKSELGLAANFGSQISEELKSSGMQKKIFISLFVISLLSIPFLVFLSSYAEAQAKISSTNGYLIKISISASMLFMSYFFFSQYKIYQMINLRYIHLMGFIGGGATFIAQLVNSENEELKIEVNRKLANLFMGLDDILGLIKRNKHPSEASLEQITNLLSKANLK